MPSPSSDGARMTARPARAIASAGYTMPSVRARNTRGAMSATHTGARNCRNMPMATLVLRMATKKRSRVNASMTPIRSRRGQTERGATPASGRRRAKTMPSTMPAVAKRSTRRALSGAVAHSTRAPISPMMRNEPATSR